MKIKALILTIVIGLLSFTPASATYMADIGYTYTALPGNNYSFTFEVTNTSDGASTGALDFFMISFDADANNQYSNLVWTSANGWTTTAADADLAFGGIPAVVTADSSALFGSGTSIAQGASLDGFTVTFKYLGLLLPEDQLFSWHAEFGTNDLGSGIDTGNGYWTEGSADGITHYNPPAPNPVPEPSTLLLLGSGFAGLLALRGRKKI